MFNHGIIKWFGLEETQKSSSSNPLAWTVKAKFNSNSEFKVNDVHKLL